jgi:ABC-type multidrug transport system fused ATPase/permease subunit
VALEGVTFRYPGASAPALRDVSLDIPAGAFIGVTGAVASGKSALARALLGLYPLEDGRILFDGRPLGEVPPDRRAAWTGYLPQDPFLFSGTVRENVMLTIGGDEAPPSEADERLLATAVERAALEADVRGFSEGLDTQIGELGIRLSGGQRQRVGLARGLAAPAEGRPALLVLDDPYSAVDLHTEATIATGLRDAYGPDAPPERRSTVVICSHRLATFSLLDHVIVLDGGAIVERGTHAELLAADGLYARIFRAQRRVDVETGGEAAEATRGVRVDAERGVAALDGAIRESGVGSPDGERDAADVPAGTRRNRVAR